jgi:hypothetical protein
MLRPCQEYEDRSKINSLARLPRPSFSWLQSEDMSINALKTVILTWTCLLWLEAVGRVAGYLLAFIFPSSSMLHVGAAQRASRLVVTEASNVRVPDSGSTPATCPLLERRRLDRANAGPEADVEAQGDLFAAGQSRNRGVNLACGSFPLDEAACNRLPSS